jgi:hypothetical protein
MERSHHRLTQGQFAFKPGQTPSFKHSTIRTTRHKTKLQRPTRDFTPDEKRVGYRIERWEEPVEADMPILTDDYAPVEFYVAGIEGRDRLGL